VLRFSFQLLAAEIFVALQPDLPYGLAWYHCMVTATTVGYGDVGLTTQGARLWAAFHILVSVVLLAELIGTIDTLRKERADTLHRVAQLQKRVSADLVARLIARAAELRPSVSHGNGITELEFVLCNLIELEIVSIARARPFITQFRELDKDNSGVLNLDDIPASGLINRSKTKHLQGARSLAKVAVEPVHMRSPAPYSTVAP